MSNITMGQPRGALRPGSNAEQINIGADLLREKSMSVGPERQHYYKSDLSATRRKLAEAANKNSSRAKSVVPKPPNPIQCEKL